MMCGIYGLARKSSINVQGISYLINKLEHRGPDNFVINLKKLP
jgi:asparagine synthetase B (glutamine-hydrolysing)